jgi:hypothetical protein
LIGNPKSLAGLCGPRILAANYANYANWHASEFFEARRPFATKGGWKTKQFDIGGFWVHIPFMRRAVLLLGIIIVWPASNTYSFQERNPAEQIVADMLATYANCVSYSDEGEVVTVFHNEHGDRTVSKPFTTAFVRPDKFRFEYRERRRDDWNRYIIWRSASDVRTFWSIRPDMGRNDLRLAIAGATGVSSGSAIMIPSLLMPGEVSAGQLKSLSNLTLLDVEEVDGSPASKIQGEAAAGNILVLWIDQQSNLVVKIYQQAHFATFNTETTITYRPRLNLPISPDALAFNAPAQH